MAYFTVDEAERDLEELIERAKSGEEILIRDGDNVVLLEPIADDEKELLRENSAEQELV